MANSASHWSMVGHRPASVPSQAGNAFVNLTLSPGYLPAWWGRTIFRVDDVDALYQTALAAGCTPTPPQNGAWGERYFHLTDPNGHELSFAQLLP